MKTTSLSAAIALAVFSTGAYAYTPGLTQPLLLVRTVRSKSKSRLLLTRFFPLRSLIKKKLKVSGPRQLQHFRPKSLKRSLPMFKALQVRLSLLPLLRKLFKNA